MMNEREQYILDNIGCNIDNISCPGAINNSCQDLQRYIIFVCNKHRQASQETWPEDVYHYYVTLWTIVVPILFSIIILIGICGNGLVIYVVFTTPKLKTSTHMFLVNLAVSDITFLSICVPFQTYKYAAASWNFGDVWCKIIQYLLYVTLYITIWTLVSIAAIRYIVLVHRNSRFRKLADKPLPICFVLWVVMLILHVPTLLAHQVNHYTHRGESYSYCGLKEEFTKQVFIVLFICAYLVPLCLISVLYLQVIRYLQAHSMCATRNHTMRVVKVMIVIVLVFSASWLPLNVHSLIASYGHIPDNRYYEALRIVWHCMAYSNSLVNPIIYNFASSDFREAFRYVLCCHRLRRTPRNTAMSTYAVTEITRVQDHTIA